MKIAATLFVLLVLALAPAAPAATVSTVSATTPDCIYLWDPTLARGMVCDPRR